MISCSVQPRDKLFIKGCGFSSFAKNMDKTIGKNISKILNIKYRKKLFDHTKQSAADTLKTASEGVSQKKQNQLEKDCWRGTWVKRP